MSNCALDQKAVYDNANAVVNPPTNLQRKSHTYLAKGSILNSLTELSASTVTYWRPVSGQKSGQKSEKSLMTTREIT